MDFHEISSSLSNEQFRNVLNERLKVLFKRVKAHSLGSSIIVPLNQGGTGQALTDPGADRILFWDDSDSAIEWLQYGDSIAITTNTIDAIQDIRTSASPTFTWLTLTGLTADRVVYTNGSKRLTSTAVTGTEINYVSGVTSAIQTQLNNKMDYNSVTDTFTTTDGKTVTVTNGRITSIV